MNTLTILVGVSGSGKTTYYTEIVSKKNIVRISADKIRFTLLNSNETKVYFNQEIEPKVWRLVWKTFIDTLLSKYKSDIYLDATNLTKFGRSSYINCALAFGFEVNAIFFKMPLHRVIRNNYHRERYVDTKIIARQFVKLEEPTKDEGFTKIQIVVR